MFLYTVTVPRAINAKIICEFVINAINENHTANVLVKTSHTIKSRTLNDMRSEQLAPRVADAGPSLVKNKVIY